MQAETNVIKVKNNEGNEAIYQFLTTVEELKKNSGQMTKWVDDHDILLHEHEGQVKAISNVCRHFGGPVGYHKSRNGVFTCLWHNWEYSCKDGSCLTHSGLSLRNYDVKVIDEKIYINLLG